MIVYDFLPGLSYHSSTITVIVIVVRSWCTVDVEGIGTALNINLIARLDAQVNKCVH